MTKPQGAPTPPGSPAMQRTMSEKATQKAMSMVESLATVSISERVGNALGVDALVVKLLVIAWVIGFAMWGLMNELTCTALGYAYPMYESFKALAGGQPALVARWLRYWVTFAVLSLCESLFYYFLRQNQYHHLVRFFFIVWMFLPQTCGSDRVYNWTIRPLLRANRARIDRCIYSTTAEVSGAVRDSKIKDKAVQGLAQVTTKAALATMQAGSDKTS